VNAMKAYKKVVLSGILSSLSVLIMLIGSLFSTLDLTAAAAAALTVLFALIELGKKYAFSVYLVSSILALVLLPNKSPALIFTVFAGFYPILKAYIHRIKSRLLSYTVKLVIFNLFFTAIILTGKYLFGIEEDFYAFSTVIYLLGNIAFVLYDFALDRLVMLYNYKIRKRFGSGFLS